MAVACSRVAERQALDGDLALLTKDRRCCVFCSCSIDHIGNGIFILYAPHPGIFAVRNKLNSCQSVIVAKSISAPTKSSARMSLTNHG